MSKQQALIDGQKLTEAQANNMAKRAGYACLNIKKIKCAADLGKYAETNLVDTLPFTWLLDAHQKITAALQDCDTVLANTDDVETKCSVLISRRYYIDQLMKVANDLAKAVEIRNATKVDATPKRPSFGAGEQVQPTVALQVNVSTGEKPPDTHVLGD